MFGLSTQDLTILVSLLFGVLALIGGIVLLVVIPELRQPIECTFRGFTVKTAGGMPAVIVLVGAAFVGFPVWHAYKSPPKLPVSGKIQTSDGKTISGILIGVIPASYLTLTLSDGSFSLNIPKGDDSAYQAILYLPNGEPPLFHMEGVKFNAKGDARFDHTLTGRAQK